MSEEKFSKKIQEYLFGISVLFIRLLYVNLDNENQKKRGEKSDFVLGEKGEMQLSLKCQRGQDV